jgi:predicted DNA-binding transcriptional regulator YafY
MGGQGVRQRIRPSFILSKRMPKEEEKKILCSLHEISKIL